MAPSTPILPRFCQVSINALVVSLPRTNLSLAAHRATGYAICVVLNRVGGIIGVLVGSYANVETTAPLFICGGLFGLLIVLSLALPFESMGKRTV